MTFDKTDYYPFVLEKLKQNEANKTKNLASNNTNFELIVHYNYRYSSYNCNF